MADKLKYKVNVSFVVEFGEDDIPPLKVLDPLDETGKRKCPREVAIKNWIYSELTDEDKEHSLTLVDYNPYRKISELYLGEYKSVKVSVK